MTTETRKLATIVFTDIVGFTKLTAENEPLAIQLIKTQRDILKPIVKKFNGDWLKEIGDGLLLAFNTTKEAVDCCIKIQQSIESVNDLNLRIGIHQGEVIQQGNDILGDDVNVTSRIEPFAASGGIVVSEQVNASLIRDPIYKTKLIGEPNLKGVRQHVRIYAVTSHNLPEATTIPEDAKLNSKNTLKSSKIDFTYSKLLMKIFGLFIIAVITILFINRNFSSSNLKISKNSIAVLPFANFSSDKENEYFSDGVTEEILNYLAKIKDLKVISRTSVFAYKGKEFNLKKVGETLGVNHILEGSVRKAGNKVRITAQLIEVSSDAHLWSETYERDLTDIFAVQDEIAQTIVKTLKMNYISIDETEPDFQEVNIDAYNAYLEGKHYQYLRSKSGFIKSIELFKKAISIQNDYLFAFVGLADSYVLQHEYNYADYSNIEFARESVSKALSLNPNSSEALTSNARVLTFEKADQKLIEQNYKSAIKLNPNYSYARLWYAMYLFVYSINGEEALEQIKFAEKIDPLSLIILTWHAIILDDFEQAMQKFNKAIEINPKFYRVYDSMSSYYLKEGKAQRFIKLLNEMIEKDSESEALLFRMAQINYYIGNFDLALIYFLRLIKINPYNYAYLTFTGNCYYALGKFDLADNYCNKVLKIYPEYGWAKILKSKIETEKQNYIVALDWIQSSVNYIKGVQFNGFTHYLQKIIIYKHLNDKEKIQEIILELKSKLGYREFHSYLFQACFIAEDYKEAKLHLLSFLEEKNVHIWIDPTIPHIWESEFGQIIKTSLNID